MQSRTAITCLLALGFAGCALDEESPRTAALTAELGHGSLLIQPGQNQILLAITDDHHVVYQEGNTVFASALLPGARRTVVAQVPTGNVAQPLQVGNVVFVWPAPQRALPGFGVSPLVLYTARGGAVQLSAQSAVGLVATAASVDGRQIVFTTNASADGLRGDLAYALTAAPRAQTIVLSGIALDFPNGACRPLAGFTESASPLLLAQYCSPGQTTATLSVWERGRKRNLIDNIATPFGFILDSDPDITRFVVDLADGTLATVDLAGRTQVIDRANSSRALITQRATVAYLVPGTATAAPDLRLARRGQPIQTLRPVITLDREAYNGGGYYKTRYLPPDDSGTVQYSTAVDPATGLTDRQLLDVDRGTSVALDATARTTTGSELFTQDSRLALFFVVPDATTGTGQLMAGDRRGVHAVSTAAHAFDVLRSTGSNVSYPADPIFDPARFFFASTADLIVADAADPSMSPRVVSEQAGLFYMRSHAGHGLVFTSSTEWAGAGIYLASAHP